MAQRICDVLECENPVRARGWCNAHYHRWKKYGDPLKLWENPGCGVDRCDRPHSCRGYCAPHYARWRRTGSTGPATIAEPSLGGPCSVQGCERQHKARGFCQQHHQRWLQSGDPGSVEFRAVGDSRIRDEQGRKRCTCCREWRPVEGFLRFEKSADGLHSHCYRCHRSRVLRRKYGITMDQYEAMLLAQGGGCRLCGRTDKGGRMLAVDHDHACCPGGTSCGRCARALLCTRCNTGLGAFGDDQELLAAAIDYLKEHGGKRE